MKNSTEGFEGGAVSWLHLGDPPGCRPADADPVCAVDRGGRDHPEDSAGSDCANAAGHSQDTSAGQLGPNSGPATGLQTPQLVEKM